ncbi:MAG: hypothetical protein Q4F88_06855 [Eubacteriales bacterium]|nr:hypothetical protein [Eubacteriales bacterium]
MKMQTDIKIMFLEKVLFFMQHAAAVIIVIFAIIIIYSAIYELVESTKHEGRW